MASPLVYSTVQDNALHLSDEKFNWDLTVLRFPGSFNSTFLWHMMWSPSGQKIGFGIDDGNYICIYTPITNTLIKHHQMPANHPRSYFWGWFDDFTFLEGAGSTLYVRDATSGAVLRSLKVEGNVPFGPYWKLPPWAPEPFVCITGDGVYFVKQNFRRGKAIYLSTPGGPECQPDYRVDVDPSGEWIAFTVAVKNAYRTAIKRLGDPVEVKPIILSGDPWFQAWTGRNELLHANWDYLTVVDRDGNVVRSTRVPENLINSNVSFRKFMHY